MMRISIPTVFLCDSEHPPRAARWVELVAVFGLGPLLVVSDVWPARLKMPLLGLAMVISVVIAMRRRADRNELGFGKVGRHEFGPALRVGGVLWLGSFGLALGVAWIAGLPVLPLVRESPGLFGVLCLMYLPSVIAQEWLFRSYFFWRYRDLLPLPALVAVNVLLFAWIHIVFGSWISVALSAIGGTAFGLLYLRHRSFWGVVVFHMLIGLSVFALGLGRYFYSGSLDLATQLR